MVYGFSAAREVSISNPRVDPKGQLYNQSSRFEKGQALGLESRVCICLAKLRIPIPPVFLSLGLPVISAVGFINTGSKEGGGNCTRSVRLVCGLPG